MYEEGLVIKADSKNCHEICLGVHVNGEEDDDTRRLQIETTLFQSTHSEQVLEISRSETSVSVCMMLLLSPLRTKGAEEKPGRVDGIEPL